jgi:serine/threonine-protein kinase RsbT
MLVTAASESARNTFICGGAGEVFWELTGRENSGGIRLMFRDHGPSIPDLQLAMINGWTSGKGIGVGLPGAKRLVPEFRSTL